MALNSLIPWRRRSQLPVRQVERREPLGALRQEMDQLFDDFFSGFGLAPFDAFESFSTFTPQVDVVENDREIKVLAELPGLDEKDVEVALDGTTLMISGEKKAEKEDRGDNYYHVERSYGSFRRAVPLPNEVDTDKIDATFKNGVLTVVLPKTPEARQRVKKIAVKAR